MVLGYLFTVNPGNITDPQSLGIQKTLGLNRSLPFNVRHNDLAEHKPPGANTGANCQDCGKAAKPVPEVTVPLLGLLISFLVVFFVLLGRVFRVGLPDLLGDLGGRKNLGLSIVALDLPTGFVGPLGIKAGGKIFFHLLDICVTLMGILGRGL